MKLPFRELGKILGGIDLGQHLGLSFGYIKSEMPLQSSKQKDQGADRAQFSERGQSISIYSPEKSWDRQGSESRWKTREPGSAAALAGRERRRIQQRLSRPEERTRRQELGYSSCQGNGISGRQEWPPVGMLRAGEVRCELELTAGFSHEDESVSAE